MIPLRSKFTPMMWAMVAFWVAAALASTVDAWACDNGRPPTFFGSRMALRANYSPPSLPETGNSQVHRLVIMQISCHPDDELFGAQNILAQYCAHQGERGALVFMNTAAYFESGDAFDRYARIAERGPEALNNATALRADTRIISVEPSATHLDASTPWDWEDAAERLTRVIREVRPDVILSHGPGGEYGHIEHRATHAAVTSAVLRCGDAKWYPDQLAIGLSPWDVKKYYEVRHPDFLTGLTPPTLEVPGNVHSPILEETYHDYGYRWLLGSYLSQQSTILFYGLPETSHWRYITGTVADPDGVTHDMLHGLSYGEARPLNLSDWLICGPFVASGSDMGVDYLTEDGGEAGVAPVAGMRTNGQTWTPRRQPHGYINFRRLLQPVNANAVAYAHTTIDNPTSQGATLLICAHDAVKVWLNGKLAHDNPDARAYSYEDRVPLTLRPGANRLLVKVQARGLVEDPLWGGLHPRFWGFFARLERDPVTAPGETRVTPASDVDFGEWSHTAGPSAPREVRIANIDGALSLSLTGVSVTPGADPTHVYDFILEDSGEPTLAPGAERVARVRFDPAGPGVSEAWLTITGNDADEPLTRVRLGGIGVEPPAGDAELVGGPLRFGAWFVDDGPSSPLSIRLANTASIGEVTLRSATFTGPDADRFSILADSGEASLLPGEHRELQIVCDPAATGPIAASLTLQTNAGAVATSLSAVGVTRDNLALNRPSSGSVDHESNYAPALAVDGVIATNSYWSVGETPAWWRVDLEAIHRLDQINIWNYWDGSRHYQFTIEASLDGDTWTEIVDLSDNTTAASPAGFGFGLEPINARHLRVNMLFNSANPGLHIVEFQAFGDNTPTLEVSRQGVTLTPDQTIDLGAIDQHSTRAIELRLANNAPNTILRLSSVAADAPLSFQGSPPPGFALDHPAALTLALDTQTPGPFAADLTLTGNMPAGDFRLRLIGIVVTPSTSAGSWHLY